MKLTIPTEITTSILEMNSILNITISLCLNVTKMEMKILMFVKSTIVLLWLKMNGELTTVKLVMNPFIVPVNGLFLNVMEL